MGYSLDSTLLGGTAAVVRNRRDIDDVEHLVAQRVQRTHRRLATRARALDAHFHRLLGGHLGSERGGLARTTETGAAGSGPRQGIALTIGDGDDGVVEGGLHVGHGIRDNALDLLLGLDRLSHNFLRLLVIGAATNGRFPYLSRSGTTAQVHYFLIARRGPLRVRALVRVRWPRTGRPRRWRRPR